MNRIILISLLITTFFLQGCATIYQGFTAIRIKADDFSAKCGPFHTFTGKKVDAMFARDCQITGDKKRKLKDKANVKMGDLEIRSRGDYTSL